MAIMELRWSEMSLLKVFWMYKINGRYEVPHSSRFSFGGGTEQHPKLLKEVFCGQFRSPEKGGNRLHLRQWGRTSN